jgi:hypothetical protein
MILDEDPAGTKDSFSRDESAFYIIDRTTIKKQMMERFKKKIGGLGSMDQNRAIITVNLLQTSQRHDLDVPLDISASELCDALFQRYLPERHGDMRQYYLKAERPIALLRGERTLREYGVRDGSVINITRQAYE